MYISMSSVPKWYFEETTSDDSSSLSTAAHFEKDISGVVREFTQNSLDSKRNGEATVTVKISLVSMPKSKNTLCTYFDGTFRGHVDRIKKSKDQELKRTIIDALDMNTEDLQFALVLEDFGTIGLQGDIHCVESGAGEHFQAFMRAQGSSESKSNVKLGSWGLGKATLWLAGAAKSIFVYSVRHNSTPSKVLMGRCILPSAPGPKVGGVNESSNGYWGVKRMDKVTTGKAQVQMSAYSVPVVTDKLCKKLVDDFKLERDAEPGLSVVIPYYTPSDTFLDSMANVFAEEWALVITEGGLNVYIYDKREKPNPTPIVLDKNNIANYESKFKEKSLARVFAMSRLAKKDMLQLNYKIEHNLDAESFINEYRKDIEKHYEGGKGNPVMIAINNIPVNNAKITQEYGQLYVMITPGTEGTYYVQLYRDYLRIGVSKGKPADSLRTGLPVGIDLWAAGTLQGKKQSNPVAALIRDGELPSHTDVKPTKSGNFDRENRDKKVWLFIKNLPARLARVLDYGSGIEDLKPFADIFPIGVRTDTSSILCIDTERLPKGIVKKDYRTRVRGNGGTKPYKWSVSLNDYGICIEPNSGMLTIPAQTKKDGINLTVSLSDASDESVSKEFTVDFKTEQSTPNEATEFSIVRSGTDSVAVTIGGIPDTWVNGCKVIFGYRRDGITVGESLSKESYADLGTDVEAAGTGITAICIGDKGEVAIAWTVVPQAQIVVKVMGASLDENRELVAKLEGLTK